MTWKDQKVIHIERQAKQYGEFETDIRFYTSNLNLKLLDRQMGKQKNIIMNSFIQRSINAEIGVRIKRAQFELQCNKYVQIERTT